MDDRKLVSVEEDVNNLDRFPQWQAEVGHWIGEYALVGAGGKPYESSFWNYRFDDYRGFVTGNIQGLVSLVLLYYDGSIRYLVDGVAHHAFVLA